MKEVEQVSKTISDFNRRAKIIFGVSQDNDYKDKIRISLLAVGCGREDRPKAGSPKAKKPQPLPQREKPKKKHKPKARPKKKTKKPSLNKKSASTSVLTEAPSEEEPDRVLTRRNALDLRKAVEEVEEEMEAKEKKWEIPAFLRRKPDNNK